MKTTIVAGKYLFPFRTQKSSRLRLRVVVSVKRQSTDVVFDFFILFVDNVKYRVDLFFLMKEISKKEAQRIIEDYFLQDKIDPNLTKKIKTLAMAHRIRLGDRRKRFCKKCFNDLGFGKVRVSKDYKQITCLKCGIVNRWKLKVI